MAAGKMMPLVLVGGAALLMMGGKKKKKTAAKSDEGAPYTPTYEEDEYEPAPYVPPSPAPKPSTPSRPAGNPPRGSEYDEAYWGSTPDERLTSIRQHFADLGYMVEVGPYPMNILGPKGSVEMKNIDGTLGKLGGQDDKSDATVKKFQHDYNVVSRLNKAEKIYAQSMGGLSEDGFVGPYVLNALRYAKEGLPGGKTWPDLLLMAKNKGIS